MTHWRIEDVESAGPFFIGGELAEGGQALVTAFASRFKPATAIRQASARPSSRFPANSSPCSDHRLMVSPRAWSFVALGGSPTARRHDGTESIVIGIASAPA